MKRQPKRCACGGTLKGSRGGRLCWICELLRPAQQNGAKP